MLWLVLYDVLFLVLLCMMYTKTYLFTIREHHLKVNNLPFNIELLYESASLNYTRKGINKKEQTILYPIRYSISVNLDFLTCPVGCSVTYSETSPLVLSGFYLDAFRLSIEKSAD